MALIVYFLFNALIGINLETTFISYFRVTLVTRSFISLDIGESVTTLRECLLGNFTMPVLDNKSTSKYASLTIFVLVFHLHYEIGVDSLFSLVCQYPTHR